MTHARHGNSAHVGDSCRQQLCIQNCGQTAADRDMVTMTAYKNSSSPYQRYHRQPPTTYDLATIHVPQTTTDRRHCLTDGRKLSFWTAQPQEKYSSIFVGTFWVIVCVRKRQIRSVNSSSDVINQSGWRPLSNFWKSLRILKLWYFKEPSCQQGRFRSWS